MSDDTKILKEIHQTFKNIERILFCFLVLLIVYMIDFSPSGLFIGIIALILIVSYTFVKLPRTGAGKRHEQSLKHSDTQV